MTTPPLPPLNALRAFESAARHLNFTRAAAELHVTHGAVSRQVGALEEHLRLPLFVRGPRGLALTEAGTKLARAASAALDMLRSAAGQLMQAPPTSTLRVNVPPTLAMWWLIPRMTALHHAHPQLRIELTTGIEPVDFARGDCDAAIRRIVVAPKGVRAERFLDGRSLPICSPEYQETHKLRGPADLARATLVVSRSEPSAWSDWLRASKVRRAADAPVLTFEQLYFAIQAALDSLGVALAPAALVADEIRRGRLRALAKPHGPAARSYALLSPRVSARRAAIAALGDWLKASRR